MIHSPVYRCPKCKQELPEGRNTPTFPFCSKRCKMIDLGNWLSGEYHISEPLTKEESERLADSESEWS